MGGLSESRVIKYIGALNIGLQIAPLKSRKVIVLKAPGELEIRNLQLFIK